MKNAEMLRRVLSLREPIRVLGLHRLRVEWAPTLRATRRVLASLILFPIFLGLADVGVWAQQKSEKVRVGYFSNITHAQALIGRANNWFQEDLGALASLDWKIFNAGPSAVEALFAGQLDIAYIGPSPAVNAYVKSEGEAVRIVAGASAGGAALVVRPDVAIASPADFHGKKIASPQLGNTQDVSLRSWLKAQGIRLKDAGGDTEVLPVANADQVALFLKKELDASWSVEPWVSILEKKTGAKVFLNESELWKDGKYATTVVLVRTKFLKEHPQLVNRFLKTHARLTEWIHTHPNEAKSVFKAEFERETGREFSQEILEAAWKRVEFTTDAMASSIQEQADNAYKVGFLKKKPDLKGFFVTSPELENSGLK